MKTVVITGSTRGIGFGLAEAFLQQGCNVVVCGRNQAGTNDALKNLSQRYPQERIYGQVCDVSDYHQVEALWENSKACFGRVDIWINNAAVNNRIQSFWELQPHVIKGVFNTNLMGTLNGCHVAIKGMIEQGGGHIYNMEGLGSGGELMSGNTSYGTSKYTLRYLSKSFNRELNALPVKVSNLSPGMVTTDLLMNTVEAGQEERAKRIFNILADKVETVAPWLAEQVLKNDKAGARISWLNRPKIISRFLLAPLRKRNLFADQA